MQLKSLIGAVLLTAFGTSVAGSAPEQNPVTTPDPIIPQDYIETGRYSRTVNEPYLSQRNPLKIIVNTRIPNSVGTVEQAVQFLLLRSGYRLADASVRTHEAKVLLNHPLPQIHRQLGPITLDKALQTLAGDAFELVVDPINRKVTYVASRDLVGG
jgi:type IV pili sensor histidine kinase/response regulator